MSDKLGQAQMLASCLLLVSCGLLIKNQADESVYKIDKYQYENAREWSPEFISSDDSLGCICIDFMFGDAKDASLKQGISHSFTFWRYPLNVSLKSRKAKVLPSLPEVKPRSVTYKYYEIRGEPLRAQIKDRYFFEAPVGNYLVLFNALGFQQDLIKHVEVRKGLYSVLKVYAYREAINIY